jgi:hypothetical protein
MILRLLSLGVLLLLVAAACGADDSASDDERATEVAQAVQETLEAAPSATATASPTPSPTATASPTSSPTATTPPTATPSPTPTSSPIPPSTPTPTPVPTRIGLHDATAQGLVTLTALGRGLQWIEVTLISQSTAPLEVTIPAGTIFEAHTITTQNMVVTRGQTVLLQASGETSSLQISVACMNMELDQPCAEDTFAVSQAPPPEDLLKLLNLSGFLSEDFRVQQFAIWTITENPASPASYVGLSTGFSPFGSGPTGEELTRIRALFERAGIDPSLYPALP